VGPGFVRRHLKRSGSNLDLIHVHWPSHTAQTPVERGLGRFGAREWVLSATRSKIRIVRANRGNAVHVADSPEMSLGKPGNYLRRSILSNR
jgi:hypothetical protein